MDAIKVWPGNVEVEFTGRELTVRDYDSGQERDYVWAIALDSVQTGQILGELLSTQELITPDSIVGAWLQQAFNAGLGQGRAEVASDFEWLAGLSDEHLTDLGDAVVEELEIRNVPAKEFTS